MSLWPYLVYPLIMTIPLCFTVFGVNALLGYLWYPLVYAGTLLMAMVFIPAGDTESVRYLDLPALTLPLAYSTFTGFFDIGMVIIQRMIYVFGGVGLVLGAVIVSEKFRRSNAARDNARIGMAMAVMLACSAGCVWLDQKPLHDARSLRAELRARYNELAGLPNIKVTACSLDLVHDKRRIEVNARLTLANPSEAPLERVLLTLNPGFEVTGVTSPLQSLHYTFDNGVIEIRPGVSLNSGDSLEVAIAYDGSIDNEATYLHIPEDFRERVHRTDFLVLGKKLSYISPWYVLLPPEVNWYPSALPSSPVTEPGYLQRDTARYVLTIKTRKGLTAVSQGQRTEQADGTQIFNPETPLTQISLAIAPFRKTAIVVDGIEYSYNWVKKDFVTKPDFSRRQLE
jgi:hypothetical protein